MGVEVGGEGVGRSDGVGSRKGGSVGRSVEGRERGVGPYVPTK